MKTLLTVFALALCITGFAQGQFQQEVVNNLKATSQKVISLAEAMPSEKMEWTPQQGVRSVQGVIGHIIGANYFFASKLGMPIPEGIDPRNIESQLKSKDDYVKALKDSYDFALKAVEQAKDEDMATKVEYPFPGEYTNMSTVIILLGHTHEHLGQMIAYARSNGITPPWSQEG